MDCCFLVKIKSTEKEPKQFFTKYDTFSKTTCFSQLLWSFPLSAGQSPCLEATTTMDSRELSLIPRHALAFLSGLFSEFQESNKRALWAPTGTGHETHQHFYKCPACHYSSGHWQRPCCFLPASGPANGTLEGWRFCKAGEMFTRMRPARKPISFIP